MSHQKIQPHISSYMGENVSFDLPSSSDIVYWWMLFKFHLTSRHPTRSFRTVKLCRGKPVTKVNILLCKTFLKNGINSSLKSILSKVFIYYLIIKSKKQKNHTQSWINRSLGFHFVSISNWQS